MYNNMEKFMLSADTARECGFGPYPVLIVEHTLIPLSDSTKLAAKIYFPRCNAQETTFADDRKWLYYEGVTSSGENEKFAVILEYLPYRKADVTAERDHRRHPWFTSHGYVVMRVDFRGAGDSDGLYYGEYLPQEQTDCLDILKWIEKQPWSNGAVGMYGKSWGGFNGLEVAYLRPPQLKAVISLYSSDDRFRTDVNHDGGTILGDELFSWGSIMFLKNGYAPDPRNVANWKDVWRNRLEKASDPWAVEWLRHQTRDDFWKQASICENYNNMQCPVLIIGGMKDGYVDAAMRMAENLPNVRAIVGPWPHEWPDTCTPGPNIDYLRLCLQWWDKHLKGKDNKVMEAPKLRLYLQDSYKPTPHLLHREGKWIQMDKWSATDADIVECRLLDGRLLICQSNLSRQDVQHKKDTKEIGDDGEWVQLPFNAENGMMSQGLWLEFGGPHGPTNQVIDDGLCLSYTSENFANDTVLLGFPKFEFKFRLVAPAKAANIVVRLCDVHPSGESTRISYGVLNLLHRKGHSIDEVEKMQVGTEYRATLQLHFANYVVPAGHRLRLGVSPHSWPQVMPPAKATQMEVLFGQGDGACVLLLPVITQGKIVPYSEKLFECKSPKVGPPLPTATIEPPYFNLSVHRNLTDGTTVRRERSSIGRTHLIPQDVIFDRQTQEEWEIDHTMKGGSLSAKVTITASAMFEYSNVEGEGPVKVQVKTHNELTSDEDNFYVKCKLQTFLNDESFFKREWNETVQREWT